jgi:hypothetical protein
MRRVIVESPYRGASQAERLRNISYLKRCLRDCIMRGESPYASHGLLPGALEEDNPKERRLGIEAGYEWWDNAEIVIFYVDYGYSRGMISARNQCEVLDKPYEERTLPLLEKIMLLDDLNK